MGLWLFNYGWCCESWCLEIGSLGQASGCKRSMLGAVTECLENWCGPGECQDLHPVSDVEPLGILKQKNDMI